MDTLGFLRAILPAEGVYFLALMQAGRDGVAHQAFTSIEELAVAVVALNKRAGVTVFHACSSYKEPYVQVGDKKRYRVPENVARAKSFWIDIDVGEEKAAKGKGYSTKNAGWNAVASFCKAQGFPLPLVVDSGGGLHCYWPLTTSVSPADWKVNAAKFKAVLKHFNVIADPTRTADMASILRPVGSSNKKSEPFREVKVKREAGPYTIDEISEALDAILDAHHIDYDVLAGLGPVPAGLNDDLISHAYPDIPCDAGRMADGCQQVNFVRSTGGGEYEHWRGVIGLLTFCGDEGFKLAHEWSSQDAGYSEYETNTKFQSWNSGPTTCDLLASVNPTGCEGCAHKGKIKTPLMLGRVEPVAAEATVETVMVKDEETDEEVPEEIIIPEDVPGYQWDGQQMVRYIRNKDDVLEAFPFCHYRFYLMQRIMLPDGSFAARIRMHLPKNKIRTFEVQTSILSSGGKDLVKELGKHELTLTNNKDAEMHITAYMKDSLNKLVQTTDEVNTMTSFGWQAGDSFLIGDRLYKPDGTVVKVMLGGGAYTKAKAFPLPKGTADLWSEGVNEIYNRDGMECMQYALCSGFGSILSPFGSDNYNGIPMALTSGQSGLGKTTVCRAALYAFGEPSHLSINGNDGMTVNARGTLMATYKNIPMLVDEITSINGEALSKLLYAAANGQDRTGVVMQNGQRGLSDTGTWQMSMYMTANKNLLGALASKQANSKAEANRIMEVKLDHYPIPMLSPNEISDSFTKIEHSVGSAGEKFVIWAVANRAEVEKRMKAMREKLVAKNSFMQRAEYRMYREHAVCTLVAAQAMKDLGLVNFDMDVVFKFSDSLLTKVCRDAEKYNTTSPEDSLFQMVSALSPRFINTKEFRMNGDPRGFELVGNMYQEPAGRYIQGDALNKEPNAGTLFLSQKAAKDWCGENRIDLDNALAAASRNGWLNPMEDELVVLGRGTDKITAPVKCYAFNMDKMNGDTGRAPLLRVVGKE